MPKSRDLQNPPLQLGFQKPTFSGYESFINFFFFFFVSFEIEVDLIDIRNPILISRAHICGWCNRKLLYENDLDVFVQRSVKKVSTFMFFLFWEVIFVGFKFCHLGFSISWTYGSGGSGEEKKKLLIVQICAVNNFLHLSFLSVFCLGDHLRNWV